MSKDLALPSPFVVLSLPRSRSAWISHWLNYADKKVGHDIAIMANSAQDFINSFSFGMAGTVETGAMLGWRLLQHEIPSLRTLVVLRNPDEVIASLARLGLSGPEITNEIYSRAHMLAAISQHNDVRTISWSDLDSQVVRCVLFEWLLELPFDEAWDERFASTNIQIDFQARLTQLQNRSAAITALKAEIVSRQLKIGMSGCPIFN